MFAYEPAFGALVNPHKAAFLKPSCSLRLIEYLKFA